MITRPASATANRPEPTDSSISFYTQVSEVPLKGNDVVLEARGTEWLAMAMRGQFSHPEHVGNSLDIGA
jgi:hypothetical protein